MAATGTRVRVMWACEASSGVLRSACHHGGDDAVITATVAAGTGEDWPAKFARWLFFCALFVI